MDPCRRTRTDCAPESWSPPFFAHAATIVGDTWHQLDRMAGALDQCAELLSADSADYAVFELMASELRELERRLKQVEAALSAYLTTP